MERQRNWRRLVDYPTSLQTLSNSGYRIFNLEGTSKNRDTMGTNWTTAALPPLREVTNASLRAELLNSRNMATDHGFAVPWDLHPRSLHAEFSHNTDLLATLASAEVSRSREVGIHPDSEYGLGGGYCKDVLRDGTAAEMVGRLCVMQGRKETIEAAVASAELSRPLTSRRWLRSANVFREARRWRIDGKMRTRSRKMVRVEGEDDVAQDGMTVRRARKRVGKGSGLPPGSEKGARRRGGGKGRGRGADRW